MNKKRRKQMKMIMNLINGFCMALADSVPGVSGGTIAFLLGFYDKFIGALDSLIAGKKEEKTKKVLDFWGKRWYSIKAVARDSPDGGTGRKEFEKSS